MTLAPGDRIRYECTGDDGLPLVRYGFVGGVAGSSGPVVVMLDGELGGDVVNLAEVSPVSVSTIELTLHGTDLVDDPSLRRGLLSLWQAEADTAGLDLDAVCALETGCDDTGTWDLAHLRVGCDLFVLRARRLVHDPDAVIVRAEPPHRSAL